MTAAKLREQYLFNADCKLVTATTSTNPTTVVGQAFIVRFWYPSAGGYVIWVTQLCVHKDHRGSGVGKALCAHGWQTDGDFASGLVTSHPYAVCALEKVSLASWGCLPMLRFYDSESGYGPCL